MSITIDSSGVEQQTLRAYTEKAYRDYSMYVIWIALYRMSPTASNRSSGGSFMP